MEKVIEKVMEKLVEEKMVEVEVSARHVHLSQKDLEILFGTEGKLTFHRSLSQPGQYLCKERLTLVGPKGTKERTAILGPVRPSTQVELSKSDCVALGVKAPVRQSGDVVGSGVMELIGPCGRITLNEGVIIAQSHIHMEPATAKKMELSDKQLVSVQMLTKRPVTFHQVVVRVSDQFTNRMHVDFDEANCCCVEGFTMGKIIL